MKIIKVILLLVLTFNLYANEENKPLLIKKFSKQTTFSRQLIANVINSELRKPKSMVFRTAFGQLIEKGIPDNISLMGVTSKNILMKYHSSDRPTFNMNGKEIEKFRYQVTYLVGIPAHMVRGANIGGEGMLGFFEVVTEHKYGQLDIIESLTVKKIGEFKEVNPKIWLVKDSKDYVLK